MPAKNDLIGKRVEVLDKGWIELHEVMGDDLAIVNAARVSFLGEGKGDERDKKLLFYLLRHRHTTPFEMVEFKFRVRCPLFVARQWMRHRTWCLAGDTEITFNRPDTWSQSGLHTKDRDPNGQAFTLARLYQSWMTPHLRERIRKMLLRVYDEDSNEFTVSHVEEVIYSGQKEVFEIETGAGKTLKCTKDHLILTAQGWQRLEDAVGLRRTQNTLAAMSKECLVATNGTTDVWRNYGWLKARRDKGDPVQKIAHEADCSPHTIRNWLNIHGLHYNPGQNIPGVRQRDRELDRTKKGTPLTAHYSKVENIRYIGVVDTYDLVVAGPHHNFLANGIVVHNSYNEVSRRYTDVDIDFYYPQSWRQQSTSNKQGSEGEIDSTTARKLSESLDRHHHQGLEFYNQALEAGVAKEQARIFLPQSMYTQFIAKVDAHNLLHFIGLRMAPDAQYEIRVYAKAIFEEFVTPAIPWTAEAFEKFVLNKK